MINARITLFALFASFQIAASAQQSVDIGLYEAEDGALEIRVTPATDLDGVLSNLSFTLAWDNTTSASFGTPLQDDATRAAALVAPSGGIHTVGPTNYRIYTVVGMTSFSEVGLHWEAGVPQILARIPVNGQVRLEPDGDL